MMRRRTLLLSLAAPLVGRRVAIAAAAPSATPTAFGEPAAPVRSAAAAPADAPAPPFASLRFPTDFGSHPETRTEWWYITGSLHDAARQWGFQVTFFRSATGLDAPAPGSTSSAFVPSQLVFAHAALTDLERRRLRHDQRIGRSGFGIAGAATGDTRVVLKDWDLVRAGGAGASRYETHVRSDTAGFGFTLNFAATQPVLLQGDAGFSKKGPGAGDASRYYSEPQLAAAGTLTLDGRAIPVDGRAWLDHEWSDAFLPTGAVGWDWIGMNLDDGGALTAFRLRAADGSTVYAGGSFRRPGADAHAFGSADVRFTPGRAWGSPATRARYPVEWRVDTPAGRFEVRARLDAQELDSRGSVGAVYWEGLADLLDPDGRRVGSGYLEMTGYASRLRL